MTNMRDHVRILGILNIVMGCFTALIGLVVLFVLGGLSGVISSALAQDPDMAHVVSPPVVAFFGMCIAIFFLVLGLPAIIGGWGLLNLRPWARILIIIISVLHLLHFPFGTALGVYGLWVLLGEQGRRLFEGAAPPHIPGSAYGYQQPVSPASSQSYPPPPPPRA